MNSANKKSEAELDQLCQAFLFNLQFIIYANRLVVSLVLGAWLSLQTEDWALATRDRPRHLKLESQGRSGVLEIVRPYYKKRSVLGGTVAVLAVVMLVRSRKVERAEDIRRD